MRGCVVPLARDYDYDCAPHTSVPITQAADRLTQGVDRGGPRQLHDADPTAKAAVVHAGSLIPLLHRCVQPLHALEVGRAVKSANRVQPAVDHAQAHTTAPRVHGHYRTPLVRLWVISGWVGGE